MLQTIRHPDLRREDILFRESSLLHSRFRINVQARRGLVDDDALGKVKMRPLAKDRSLLVVQLEGHSLWRTGQSAQLLGPGDFLVTHRNIGIGCRLEGAHRNLLVDWEPGLFCSRDPSHGGTARVSQAALPRLRSLAQRVEEERLDASRGAEVAAGIFEILRQEGLPFDPLDAGSLREEVPPRFVQLSRAIEAALSNLASAPAILDIEGDLGWHRNQIHQVLSDFQKTYAFHAVGGWRALRRSWLNPLGSCLMSVPGMRTEEAAAILGYSSPQAFCIARANAGLPSPGRVRDLLKQLA